MHNHAFVALVILLACVIGPAAAQDRSMIVFGAGAIGVIEHGDRSKSTSAVFSAEYRSPRSFFHVSPMAGVLGSTDSDAYVSVGVYHDFTLNPRWILTPHLSIGVYHHGAGNDLGGSFPFFQPGIDLFHRLQNGARVGVSVRHLSNSFTRDRNPGTEMVMLVYGIPLGGR